MRTQSILSKDPKGGSRRKERALEHPRGSSGVKDADTDESERGSPPLDAQPALLRWLRWCWYAIQTTTLCALLGAAQHFLFIPFLRDGSKGELRKDHPRIVTVWRMIEKTARCFKNIWNPWPVARLQNNCFFRVVEDSNEPPTLWSALEAYRMVHVFRTKIQHML